MYSKSKQRNSRILFSAILVFVLAIAEIAIITSQLTVREVTKTFPTRTFTVGAHPKLLLQTKNADTHIRYGNVGTIKVEAKASASGLDLGSNLDFSSFKIDATQSGDTVTVNADANTTVIGGSKRFDLTITVPRTTVVERCHAGFCATLDDRKSD